MMNVLCPTAFFAGKGGGGGALPTDAGAAAQHRGADETGASDGQGGGGDGRAQRTLDAFDPQCRRRDGRGAIGGGHGVGGVPLLNLAHASPAATTSPCITVCGPEPTTSSRAGGPVYSKWSW